MTKPRIRPPVDLAPGAELADTPGDPGPTAADATVQFRAGHRGNADRVKASIEQRRGPLPPDDEPAGPGTNNVAAPL